MSALIRNQGKFKFLKASYNNVQKTTKNNKYSTTHYRSPLATMYRLNSSSLYNMSGSSLARVRLTQIPQFAPIISVACDNESVLIPTSSYSFNARRAFHLGSRLHDIPSSKVEVTVQKMKEKQKEKVEEIIKEANTIAAANGSTEVAAAKPKADALKTVVVKKSLQTRIWEELVHYYHGFRLLFIDINICRRLLWRVLNGKTLTRRENKLLVRTTSDLFRLIPFSVFIIVPFMELLLPVFIKFFPGMLPSTFQTAKEREDKLKQSLQVRLEMAKFLQKTLDEMSVQHKGDHKSEEAKQFSLFFQKIKNPNEYVSTDEIIKFAKRFEDEITLDSLSREQLAALCRVLELNTMGTTNLLRFQLRVKLRSLAADDRVIHREGVKSLDLFELQQACKSRGMRAYGLTAARLCDQLQEWIDLSLNEKVPPTLLLLSRAMLIADDTATSEKLKETIRVLPDVLAAQTKAAIGEREGKIDNKTKIEVIKEEERKIREEREEEREVEKAKAEILLDKAPVIEASAPAVDPIVAATAVKVELPLDESQEAIEKEKISSKDVELLSEALKTLSSDKKTMSVEKETIKDLKEELEEYKEDVEELQEVRDVVKEPVHESRAAKLLFKKVSSMIGQLDQVLVEIEKKHQQIHEQRVKVDDASPEQAALKRKEEELVRIDELLRQTTDVSRLKHIESVLSKLDQDKDGIITVDEVMKVVEAMGRDNVNLDEKQLQELITLLDKEQLLEAEEKIEKALAKSIKEEQKIEATKLQRLAEAAALEDELKDIAPTLTDKATDLSADDQKHLLKEHTTTKSAAETSILEASEKQADKCLPQADLSRVIPTTSIPTSTPPPTTTTPPPATQAKPKDKML